MALRRLARDAHNIHRRRGPRDRDRLAALQDRGHKTEDGLGLSNFLLAKNEDKLKWKRDTRASVLVCLAKGGGLTFYAYGLAPDGASAKETKLRVHRGDVSIDGVNGFSLMTFGAAG